MYHAIKIKCKRARKEKRMSLRLCLHTMNLLRRVMMCVCVWICIGIGNTLWSDDKKWTQSRKRILSSVKVHERRITLYAWIPTMRFDLFYRLSKFVSWHFDSELHFFQPHRQCSTYSTTVQEPRVQLISLSRTYLFSLRFFFCWLWIPNINYKQIKLCAGILSSPSHSISISTSSSKACSAVSNIIFVQVSSLCSQFNAENAN